MAAVAAGAGAASSRPVRGGGEALGPPALPGSDARHLGARRAGEGAKPQAESLSTIHCQLSTSSLSSPLPSPSRPAGRRGRRIVLVGNGADRLCRWQHGQPRRAKHDRAGRLRRRRLFGPNTWNFRDIVAAMLDHEAAVVVQNAKQFTGFVRRCLEQPDYAAALGERAQSFVRSQIGATSRTLVLVTALTR